MKNGKISSVAPALSFMERAGVARSSGLRRNQRGISIMIVIFLLAVVSVLAVSMMNVSTTQHIGSMYAARAAQAYFSARSGIEYAVTSITTAGNPVTACTNVNGSSITVQGFNVALTCTVSPPGASPAFNEGNTDPAVAYRIYSLTATASGGTFQVPDVVNRRIQVSVKFP